VAAILKCQKCGKEIDPDEPELEPADVDPRISRAQAVRCPHCGATAADEE
jgi:DNA-directed RNA polymerase subunit RPC12/RpoP